MTNPLLRALQGKKTVKKEEDIAFKDFERIFQIKPFDKAAREWLRDYEGLYFSVGENERDLIYWQNDKQNYVYTDSVMDEGVECFDRKRRFPNKIQRHPQRLVIEFDDKKADDNKDKQKCEKHLSEVQDKLTSEGYGFIRSTHEGSCDYLWIEFDRDLSSEEAGAFLKWIAPEGSEIDLNFSSDKKRFPVLFMPHWKYSAKRELPIIYQPGKKIPFDSLGIKIKKEKRRAERTGEEFQYKTYIRRVKALVQPTQSEEENFIIKNKVRNLLFKKQREEVTELIAQEFLKRNHVYTTRDDVKSEIWIYNNEGIYVPQGLTYIQEFCRKVCEAGYTPQLSSLVAGKISADTFIDADKFFNSNNKEEIPVLNGILNIRTRELREFNSKNIFFNKLPVKYEPESKCPAIDKHFSDVLDKPGDKKVMYELCGYCLLKDHPIEKAFMFLGDGRNGKGKTLELIKRLVGAENCCSIPLVSMKEDSFNLSEMFGKLVNLAGDLNNTSLKDTGLFKSITGRDTITAHRKFKRDIIFVNYSKQLFACNELPRVYDLSRGFWSRWILLNFPYEFVKQEEFDKLTEQEKMYKKVMDISHLDKITTPEEMSGLLNAALEGLDRLFKQKDFSYSIGVAEIKESWIRKSSPFMAFCYDCIEGNDERYLSKKELRKAFNTYCKKEGIRGAGDREIKATLEDLYGVSESRPTIDEQTKRQEWVWEGITLKEDIKAKAKYSKDIKGFQAI